MRGVRYLGGSTRKVAQLTGEFDRERGQSTRSQTASQFGLAGTDLGASFEHAGRVYFLFGDSVSAIGYNDVRPEAGDAIAFTTTRIPRPGSRCNSGRTPTRSTGLPAYARRWDRALSKFPCAA